MKSLDLVEMASITARQLSEQERARIIERARRELPERDRRFKEAMAGLNRISRGLPPKA
jgi:hypothetical protein